MRPKKIRWVKCGPQSRCFKPQGRASNAGDAVTVSLDEFEAMRLLDLEGLSQEAAARRMKVHRSTVSRMMTSGHKKLMAALVQCRALKIEGGCCKIISGG